MEFRSVDTDVPIYPGRENCPPQRASKLPTLGYRSQGSQRRFSTYRPTFQVCLYVLQFDDSSDQDLHYQSSSHECDTTPTGTKVTCHSPFSLYEIYQRGGCCA